MLFEEFRDKIKKKAIRHAGLLYPIFLVIVVPACLCYCYFAKRGIAGNINFSNLSLLALVGLSLFLILYGILIYESFKTYFIFSNENKRDKLWADKVTTSISEETLPKESQVLLNSLLKFDNLIQQNKSDKEELKGLQVPHPHIDDQGYPTLEGFAEIIKRSSEVKPKENKNILEYGRLKLDRTAKWVTAKELVSIVSDSPIYAEMASGLQTVSQGLNFDVLFDTAKDVGENISEMVNSAARATLGDSFAEHISDVHIPLGSTLFETIKQGGKLIDGDISFGDALKQSGTKIGLKSALSGAGAFLGTVLGPAGSIVGGFVGGYLGSLMSNEIKAEKYNDMINHLKSYQMECKNFVEESQDKWKEAQRAAAVTINKYVIDNEKNLEERKAISPLDKLDKPIFYYSVCFILKEYIVAELTKNKLRNADVRKYIPYDKTIKKYPQESLKSLLWALTIVTSHVQCNDYYNPSLILSQINQQCLFDYVNMLLTQERWKMDVYDKFYNSIKNIAAKFKKENEELVGMYHSIESENKLRCAELQHRLNEVEKEKRRIK